MGDCTVSIVILQPVSQLKQELIFLTSKATPHNSRLTA